jgi:hypothetical protein
MVALSWFLRVLALVLFILAAINVPSPRVSLGWAGMAALAVYWIFLR